MTSAKRALLYLLLSKGYAMCQRVYLLSRIFDLLFVVLKRAYFPRIAVSHKCFMVSGCYVTPFLIPSLAFSTWTTHGPKFLHANPT